MTTKDKQLIDIALIHAKNGNPNAILSHFRRVNGTRKEAEHRAYCAQQGVILR